MSKLITDVEKNNALGTRFVFGDFQFTSEILAKMKQLHAWTGANHATPRELGASSGYVVPTNKKFIVFFVRIAVQIGTGGANSVMSLQSATSDVGFNSASGPTGRDDGGSGTTASNLEQFQTAGSLIEVIHPYVISAGRYLTVSQNAGNGFWQIYGFEVDANATSI